MKRYVKADTEHFTVKGWVETPYPYPSDVEYVVIQDVDGDTVWEGNSWDLPEEYYSLNLVDEEYDGSGLCILTVKKKTVKANKLISCVPVETYKGYLITCCLYGEDYNTKGGYKLYCVDYDKRTIKFDTVEEARAFIDELL